MHEYAHDSYSLCRHCRYKIVHLILFSTIFFFYQHKYNFFICKKDNMCSIVNETNVTVQKNNVVLTTIESRVWYVSFLSRDCVCTVCWSGFKGSSLCFFGYVGHNKYWRGSEVSETALIIQTQSVCVWTVLAILWFLEWILSGSMKTPVLLCVLLFSQSWAFEFIIDGEWESETVRLK